MEKTIGQIEYVDNNGHAFDWDALLPCPFCGAMPKITFIGNNWTKKRRVVVKCPNPHCRTEQASATINHNHEWIAKDAIRNWNKRV